MHEIKLPQLGQSVEEASIVAWHKNEGDTVEKGELLFSVQTDKAEIECESTAAGVLRKILVEPGVEVPVMTVVALVGNADEPLPDLSAYDTAPSQSAPEPEEIAEPPATVAVETDDSADWDTEIVSPRAQKRAAELKVSPGLAQGTGAGGRVTEADVVALSKRLRSVKITPAARQLAVAAGLDITRIQGTGPGGKITKADIAEAIQSGPAAVAEDRVERVPLTPMRRIVAQRMSESMAEAPHYYETFEVDMSAAIAFRKALGSRRPSLNDLIVYCVARAIRKYPRVNARWSRDAIELVKDINIGIAVALPEGLVVPVLRRVQQMSLDTIRQESRALIKKARAGKLLPDEYADNTFTISNLGAFGVDHFTAIINQPDSAILAVGEVKDRPVVISGGIHIRPMMKMTISSDHRVIDGAVAAQFMSLLRDILEEGEY